VQNLVVGFTLEVQNRGHQFYLHIRLIINKVINVDYLKAILGGYKIC
ncbi:uncharacterized protein METZ01_LOCUS105274, partial [marine metagenome]